MPGFDDVEIELTLRKYHSRSLDDDSVTERWEVDAAGIEACPSGETPAEALRVLAASLEGDDGAADIDVLADAEANGDDVSSLEEVAPRDDEWGEF